MEAGKLQRPSFSNDSCKRLDCLRQSRVWTLAAMLFALSQPSNGQDVTDQQLKLPVLKTPRSFSANAAPAAAIEPVLNPLLGSTTQATNDRNETLGQFLSAATSDDNPQITGKPEPPASKPSEFLPATDLPTLPNQQIQIEPTEIEIVPTGSLSLMDLESLAFEHNPTLSAAKARLSAQRGQQLQAGLYPNPRIGYQGMEMGIRGTAGQQGGFIGQRFITGGKLKLDQAAAGKRVTASHFEYHAQELRVLSDVRIRFYEAVTLQQRVKLTNELVRIGDELVRATEQLLAGRQATQNDLLLAEIQVDESRILFDNSTNEEQQAWRQLAAVIGLPAMQPTALTGQLEPDLQRLDWDTCYATVMNNNPALNAARIRVTRSGQSCEKTDRKGEDDAPG